MDVDAFLDAVRKMPWYMEQIVHGEDVPAREARYGTLDRPLDGRLEEALDGAGIDALYTHQTDAINALRSGKNVIVSTGTASGKSLCYNLPVLEALLQDRTASAMYIFPTKALAQDQRRALGRLVPRSARLRYDIFDGDTPTPERGGIRRSARLLITNPDMLHVGILPNHRLWYQRLRSLRYVVIDEAHVYRGVFGSHVANIIRRLRRICERFGSKPQFILCSATIANPGEHAERLTGLPFEVVDDDGSPYGGKDFLFWNPPMLDLATGSRRSTNTESAQLFAELLRRYVRTMNFVRSRRAAELLYVYVRDNLKLSHPDVAKRVMPYRASYLPEDRRAIERDLAEGRLLGVTTTNAMELGIDIGDLDATLLTGYPGTIASAWQQAGRSGRSGHRSLSVLVAHDNPLDQYLMRHPEAFFGRSHESARVSPGNPYILKPHLLCAAYEAPLLMDDTAHFGPELLWYAEELVEDGLLHVRQGRWYLSADMDYPAGEVNIRSASARTYSLVERDSGVILESVEEMSAFLQLHPGGIYLHQGEQYLVTDLNMELGVAYAVQTDVPYYTQARDYTDTRILKQFRQRQAGRTQAYLGEVSVTTRVVGFKRVAHITEESLGEEYVDLPPQSYDTISLWFDVPPDTLDYIRRERLDLMGGLHAVEHAAIGVLPLFAMCDRNDIGGISTPLHPDTGRPQVFIHDGIPGGVGITEHGYDIIEELWSATLQVISECPCESGCPGCIQSPKCGNNNEPLNKGVAAIILQAVLGEVAHG